MLLRSRSKDRSRKVTPPGPVAMSNEQFSSYLADLRNNRVTRPSGARPLPGGSRQESTDKQASSTPSAIPSDETSVRASADLGPRSMSAMSHRRAESAMSTYSTTSRTGRQLAQQPKNTSTPLLKSSEVVPSHNYIERGMRWMEKEEAVALREAMEDMDIKKQEEEEARIHAAAQAEASELVFQHQTPEHVNPDAPYRYNEHLRKNSYAHARTQSVGRYNGLGIATGLARDLVPRSVSGGSTISGGMMSPRSPREPIMNGFFEDFDRNLSPEPAVRHSLDSTKSVPGTGGNSKSYGGILNSSRPVGSKRIISGRRNISGEVGSSFTGSQIWEEPEDISPRGRAQEERDFPAPLRLKPRNPLHRVQFAQDVTTRSSSTPPEQTKKLHKTEIQRNPPTQSRNPLYTANSLPVITTADLSVTPKETPESPATKDGLEIRSDEIRQATSMRLKDRSPKLPVPTAVSDKPGRPIVSFDSNWKPTEADVKPEARRRSPFDRPSGQRQSIHTRSDSKEVASPSPPVLIPKSLPSQIVNSPFSSSPTVETSEIHPSVLTIKKPESKQPEPKQPEPKQPEPSKSEPQKPESPKSDPKRISPFGSVSGPRPLSSLRKSPFARPSIPTMNTSPLPRTSLSSIATPSSPTTSIPTTSVLSVAKPSASKPSMPAVNVPMSRPSILAANAPRSEPAIPTINISGTQPSIPTINIPPSQPSIPTINLPDSTPSIPTINIPDTSEISITVPGVPTINTPSNASKTASQRPLPDPKSASSRPRPHGNTPTPVPRGHWSPAQPVGKRATATCHQCTLPIEGRVVALHGKPEHYHPECFICFNCGTGLESLEIRFEPESSRRERIDRIRRRARGEVLPELEGQTLAEDGDERMRFYCHLDWHESFAPKCKHCKTPIMGEHTIALGAHWHYGHFFCAECGDPFEKGQTHIEKDGYAWCLSCQTKRTANRAPKCKSCKKPVIGQYTVALGGEWHDECFRCNECKNGFEDGCFYPKEVKGETVVLCIPCAEMQLKA